MKEFIIILIYILGIILTFCIALPKQKPFERFDIATQCYALGVLAALIAMLII